MQTSFPTSLLYLIPALPLLGFLINSFIALVLARKNKTIAEWIPSLIGCAGPSVAFLIATWAFLVLKGSSEEAVLVTSPLFTWMQSSLFSIEFSLLFDHLSAVMTLVVTGVGGLIHFYSVGYMKGDKGFARYFSYLNLFLFFMLLLILGDNLLVLFVGWEGVGLCSYLLIGFWFTDPAKATAGKKAFVVNRIGDFGFLIGLFLILFSFTSQAQSTEISFFNFEFIKAHKEILAPFAGLITLCLFTGATGKSAQIPLYVWLPDAMAGPTPVSALIHAATMVTAGVYMVARMYFLFELAPFTLEVITGVGLATALLAALIALAQNDIKKVLAYSTVSQLGYMFLALGVGAPQTAIFHVVTHAFFKACLFLCAGSVILSMHHEQDIRQMGGLFKKIPATGFAFLVSTLAIAGVPPFSGFFSKDEILWNTFLNAPKFVYVVALLAAGLTAFYMFRLFVYVFLGETRHGHPEKLPAIMNVPVVILGLLAMIGGFMGVPQVLGGANHFHHWLSGLTSVVAHHGDHHSLELGLMALSTGWAVLMGGLAVILYRRNLNWTDNLKLRFAGVHRLLSNKFYVDEIYETLIIKPIYWLSESVLWKGADQKLVDGIFVHGWTNMAQLGARIVSRCQTGALGHYLLFLWVGLVVLLVVAMRVF